jgi:hypothetical protein
LRRIKLKAKDDNAIHGRVRLIIRDAKTNEIFRIQEQDNLIVNAGHNLVAAIMNGESVSLPNYIAVGTGTTTPAAGDTTLEGEIGRLPTTSRTRTNNQVLYSTYFGSGDCNGTWNKIGIFNASSGGTLLSELLLSPAVTKNTSVAVDCEYTITY